MGRLKSAGELEAKFNQIWLKIATVFMRGSKKKNLDITDYNMCAFEITDLIL